MDEHARARAALRRRLKAKEYDLYYAAVKHPEKGWLELAQMCGIPVPRNRTVGGLTRIDFTREASKVVRALCTRAGADFPKRLRG